MQHSHKSTIMEQSVEIWQHLWKNVTLGISKPIGIVSFCILIPHIFILPA